MNTQTQPLIEIATSLWQFLLILWTRCWTKCSVLMWIDLAWLTDVLSLLYLWIVHHQNSSCCLLPESFVVFLGGLPNNVHKLSQITILWFLVELYKLTRKGVQYSSYSFLDEYYNPKPFVAFEFVFHLRILGPCFHDWFQPDSSEIPKHQNLWGRLKTNWISPII